MDLPQNTGNQPAVETVNYSGRISAEDDQQSLLESTGLIQ